jgi:hypothetical protein
MEKGAKQPFFLFSDNARCTVASGKLPVGNQL